MCSAWSFGVNFARCLCLISEVCAVLCFQFLLASLPCCPLGRLLSSCWLGWLRGFLSCRGWGPTALVLRMVGTSSWARTTHLTLTVTHLPIILALRFAHSDGFSSVRSVFAAAGSRRFGRSSGRLVRSAYSSVSGSAAELSDAMGFACSAYSAPMLQGPLR